MLNRRYYPFERNSFYPGKLLTARDLETEQRYMNDKRRLRNRLEGGSGITAGLGVILADDASVIIQAGCAIDASGREIVVPETRVVKLSTVEGYDQLTTDNAYLGIEYVEEPEEEVYSAMSDEKGGVQFNKIREGYKLTLMDEKMAAHVPGELDQFINVVPVYSGLDARATLETPFVLPEGRAMKVRLRIERTGPGTGEYAVSFRLDTPGFTSAQGRGLQIALNNVNLACGQGRVEEYCLYPEPYVWGGGALTLAIEDFVIRRGEETFALNRRLESEVRPVRGDLDAFYLSRCYGRPMDKELMESYDQRLWIARLLLIRRGTQAIMDRVLPPPFGQYSYNAQQIMMLRRLEGYYPLPPRAKEAETGETEQPVTFAVEQPEAAHNSACGVFNLSLGLGADQRGPIFSEEIMHGLGKGPVYVDVGIEYITPDKDSGARGETILGDASIFAGDAASVGEERTYDLRMAVKVLHERGTFIVGVRLGGQTGLISLRVRWYAFRLGEQNKRIKTKEKSERMLMVNPDTIVLAPKATAHLTPVFVNMPGEACVYRVMDPEGGSVDQNGLYTAPAREGAYEVRVEAVSDPTVYTYAFMIVSQKKKEDTEESK